MVPPMKFFSPFGTPKEARKTGQSVTLAKVSLAKVLPAKVSCWPKCHSATFRRQTAEFFFSKKICQMNAAQNENDITETVGLV